MSKLVRIANGQGFWGDSIDAPVRLVEAGGIDYLTLDYLAEVTLSIMQKQRRKDPELGYATDFVDLMRRVLPQLKAKGIRVVANAGGVNPEACRTAVMKVARELRVSGLKIATVTGDDILARLQVSVHAQPHPLGLARLLPPQLMRCFHVCVANKRQADAVYWSRVDLAQLQFFLDRHGWPQPLRAQIADHAPQLAHLCWDLGADFQRAPDEATGVGFSFIKSGIYGAY